LAAIGLLFIQTLLFFLNQKKFLPLYLLLAVENMMTTLADEGGDKDCSWIFPWYLLSEKTHEECSTAMLNKESRICNSAR
jgi:hypothetical protein